MNQTYMKEIVDENIGGLLNCEAKQVQQLLPYFILSFMKTFSGYLFRFSYRKKSLSCNKTNLSVVKTIRVHMGAVVKLVQRDYSVKAGF